MAVKKRSKAVPRCNEIGGHAGVLRRETSRRALLDGCVALMGLPGEVRGLKERIM
jgi:hypothetical protein